jgi:hypothetical protein
MRTASGTERFAAAAVAICVTFSLVWSMGSLGYPAASPATQAAAIAIARGDACSGSD